MDYAILKTGGKQYRVTPGDVLDVEKLPVEEGSAIELNDVLAISSDGELILGKPLLPDASVLAQVQAQGRDKKIIVFKYKRKVRYRRKKGHRQHYTRLVITAIMLGGEEISVRQWPEQEAQVQEESPVEASDELEDESAEESKGIPEVQVDDEAAEELDDVPQDQPEDESVDEPLNEVEGVSVDEPGEGLVIEPDPEPVFETKDKPVDEPEDKAKNQPRSKTSTEPRTPRKRDDKGAGES